MTWILKTAWRDSRGDRRRLLLFALAMMGGVAALVSIHGFGTNVRTAVERQSKELLGADFALQRNQPFGAEMESLIDSLGGQQARRVSFSSMAYFPEGQASRLVRVRGHRGAYPFYGSLGTEPPEAAERYLRGGRKALVDATLMEQFQQEVGDSVRIGQTTYEIAGSLHRMPQESAAISLVSPRIYVPLAELDSTLFQQGSRVEYEVYFKFEDERDVEALQEQLTSQLRRHDVRATTPAEEAEDWSEVLDNLYQFLSLVAFMALLLGGLGVASAVHVYIQRRLDTVAILRCLGATAGRTFGVYLTQAAFMGLACALGGIALGVAVQGFLPRVLADFLPVEVPFRVTWVAIGLGGALGVGGTLLFALLPLVRVRRVAPLRSLRRGFESDADKPDGLRWMLYGLLAILITAAAMLQAPHWSVGLGYAAGLGLVFGVLALLARGVMAVARRGIPASWSYPVRQGLSNIYRPRNQTVMLTLALGTGTFVLVTLYLVQATLLAQLQVADQEGRPNLVLFDVQPDQVEEVTQFVRDHELPVLGEVPIVPMQLTAVKGRSMEAIKRDSTTAYTWAHRRSYRSTYRDSLSSTERVVAGSFRRTPFEGEGGVPVSLETEIASELDVGLGDSLTFNVQGVSMPTVVSSLREVNWRQVTTNFFVVFPEGVLEEAPQSYVVLTRADSSAASAALQADLVKQFPNVSAIDVHLVLDVFDALFERMAAVVRFMALFSIGVGLAVLAGAVVVSRYQRQRESVLLKTLGASRRQVMLITLVEYLALGLLAAGAGVGLALGAGWGLAHFVFETPFVVPVGVLAAAVGLVTGGTVAIGLFNSRGLYEQTPLAALRTAG